MTENFEQLKEEEKQTIGSVRGTANAKPVPQRNNAWVPGLVLIGIGLIFLLQNFTSFELNNWWALFILIPAFGALGNAFRVRQNAGRLTGEGRGSLMGGLGLLFVALIFLFELPWGNVWPIFLILGGIGILLGSFLD
jgi:hypothetical protein